MAKTTTTDKLEPVTLTPEMKTALGLEDCVVGDQYDLSIEVTKVNDDGSVEATIDHEGEGAGYEEPPAPPVAPPKAKKRAPAMEAVMQGA